jgi:hypothetical protein
MKKVAISAAAVHHITDAVRKREHPYFHAANQDRNSLRHAL